MLFIAAILVMFLLLIGLDDLSQIVSGLVVLIALPIWAFMLARRLPQLTPGST